MTDTKEPVFTGWCLISNIDNKPFAPRGGYVHTYKTRESVDERLAHENRNWERYSLGVVEVRRA